MIRATVMIAGLLLAVSAHAFAAGDQEGRAEYGDAAMRVSARRPGTTPGVEGMGKRYFWRGTSKTPVNAREFCRLKPWFRLYQIRSRC
jgi:hypothetical protein